MKNTITLMVAVFTVIACNSQINVHKYQKDGVTLEEIQQAIQYNLDHIKIWESELYRIPKPTITKQNYFYDYFTEKSRNRMVELFEGKWSEEEVQSQLEPLIKPDLDTLNPRNGFYNQAKRLAKRESLPLQRVWDSMLRVRKNEYRKSILANNRVPTQVIDIAGYLKDPRFLPYLKKMAGAENLAKDVELALARYGEEPHLSNAIKYFTERNDWQKLAYICTKEAIEELYKYAITNEEIACDSNGMYCYDLWAELPMGILARLFDSDEMGLEMDKLKRSYTYPKRKDIDEAYIKKMHAITEKYYKQLKEQEPNCENVQINAW